MIIKPITVRLVAYGQKANVGNIRIRATAFLKDENGSADPAAFVEMGATDVHAEILATRFDDEVALKKPTPSQAGIAITIAEVNERMATEWLQELPVAKTCVVFATWYSHKEGMAWQLLMADGARAYQSRAQKP